jgi:hypothetical protein
LKKEYALLRGHMWRENPGSKSPSEDICKFCTQATYTQRLKVELLLPKDVAAGRLTLVDYLCIMAKHANKYSCLCIHKACNIQPLIPQEQKQNSTFIPLEFGASNTMYVSAEIIPLSIPIDLS